MSDLTQQLKNLKDCEQVGSAREGWVASNRDRLMSEIGGEKVSRPMIFGAVSVIPSYVSSLVVRPVAALVLVFVLIMGGWITTVNASINTLPGDFLYPVKIITEKAQLGLVTGENDTMLRVEFAGRRLDEVASLVKQNNPANNDLITATVESFTKEMAIVENQISGYKNTQKVNEVASLAQIVNQKAEEYTQVVNGSQAETDSQQAVAVADALQTIEHTDDQVMSILVETHEQSANEASEQAVQTNFTADIQSINNRLDSLLGRLSRVETAAHNVGLEVTEQLDGLHFQIFNLESLLQETTDAIGRGGYKLALENLQLIRTGLKESELTVAEMEIAITSPAVEAEEPVEEGGEEAGSESGESDGSTLNHDGVQGEAATPEEDYGADLK